MAKTFITATPVLCDMTDHLVLDPVRTGRGPAEHHVWEVPDHGQGVPETGQSHDTPSSRAAKPDPRQGDPRWLIRVEHGLLKTALMTAVAESYDLRCADDAFKHVHEKLYFIQL